MLITHSPHYPRVHRPFVRHTRACTQCKQAFQVGEPEPDHELQAGEFGCNQSPYQDVGFCSENCWAEWLGEHDISGGSSLVNQRSEYELDRPIASGKGATEEVDDAAEAEGR
jgi:hypothetical protein